MLVQATAEYVLAGNIMYINIVSDVVAGHGLSMCWLEI